MKPGKLPEMIRGAARHGMRVATRVLEPGGVRLVHALSPHDDLHVYPETGWPASPRYVNVGAGAFYHPYWHNFDVPNDYYAKDQGDRVHVPFDLHSRPCGTRGCSTRPARSCRSASNASSSVGWSVRGLRGNRRCE
jgi:hypothetical protein